MAGEVEMTSAKISAVLPLRTKLNPLAVLSGKCSPLLPEVPTSAELGMPKWVSHSVYGVMALNRTPAEYRKYLLDESAKWGALIKPRDIRME
jgi:tripartite-type tricarboxylate transporter receptor subunit TctC